LDEKAYAEGAISKKNKELMGLAISVATRCNECILYHLETSMNAEATFDEIMEAIKIRCYWRRFDYLPKCEICVENN
jgi:alkylhydroperoxidase AhpD family core domain